MKFRRQVREEPEINLIPFIDVLLVVLIFLMLSTTYSKFTELQLVLPVADADQMRDHPKELLVSVGSDGAFAVNSLLLPDRSPEGLAIAIQNAARAGKDTVLIIQADASAKHQSVVTVMEAARRAGLNQLTFATQPSGKTGKR